MKLSNVYEYYINKNNELSLTIVEQMKKLKDYQNTIQEDEKVYFY